MATKGKDVVQRKERRGSTPSSNLHTATPNGRSPRSSTSASPEKERSTLSVKATPRYLKPTISSRIIDPGKHGKKQGSENNSLKHSHTRTRSLEKLPSPSHIKKPTPLSNLRDRSQKPSSPSMKCGSSPKYFSDRTYRTPRSAEKFQPVLNKQKSIKRNTSLPIRRDPKVSTTNTTIDSPGSPERIPCSVVIKTEQESIKVSVQESEEEIQKLDSDDIHSEILLIEDEKPINLVDPELENPEDLNMQFCDSSILSDDQEAFQSPQIVEEDEKREDKVDNKQDDDNEKKCKRDEDDNHSTIEEERVDLDARLADEPEIKEVEITEDPNSQKEKIESKDDSGDENKSCQQGQGKVLDEKEESEGNQKLRVKERGDMEGTEESKPEAKNVVLRRQDTQGKKESMAYNDVIEETASKLAKKRKSKVKALVGAFETVISLQEPEGQTPRANEDGSAES